MRIAVASGKGGTGKTTVALGLALAAGSVTIIDADVEEPNCQVLLQGDEVGSRAAVVMVPVFDDDKCDRCGACARACRFNALLVGTGGHLLFPELCHGCGACLLACGRDAAGWGEREIGRITEYARGGVRLVEGRLRVGETMGVPLIRELKRAGGDLTIVDCPPGSACAMAAAVHGADFCLLVTEPTLFGRHDLEAAMAVAGAMGVPYGVVVNRSGADDGSIEDLCRSRRARILARIPYSRAMAEAYSRGELLAELERGAALFKDLWADVREEAGARGKV